MSARDPPCSMDGLFNCPVSELFEPRQAIGGGFFDLDQRNKPREKFSFRGRVSFWRTMMSELKGIIVVVTMIAGSSLAMALNAPPTSGQPPAADSVASNPAALQHLAQSTPGGVKSGSASNRQKHKRGKYKKTTG